MCSNSARKASSEIPSQVYTAALLPLSDLPAGLQSGECCSENPRDQQKNTELTLHVDTDSDDN